MEEGLKKDQNDEHTESSGMISISIGNMKTRLIFPRRILLGSDLRVSPAGHQLPPDPNGSQHPGQFPQRLRGRQGFHPQLSGHNLKVLTVMTQ